MFHGRGHYMPNEKERERCLAEYRALLPERRSEFLRWGFPAGNLNEKVKTEQLGRWIDTVKKYPGFLLDTAYTAAKLGITEESFAIVRQRKEIEESKCTWALPEGNYYYSFLIEDFYRSLLNEQKGYSSLVTTNREVAEKLGVQPALCVVCNSAAVSLICDYCKKPVDHAHTEPINEPLQPIMFRPPQVCWRCLFTSPPQSYPLILEENEMEAALGKSLEQKWLSGEEVDRGWLEKTCDYQKQRS